MTTENRTAIDEARIRKLIDDRAKAVRAKDVDGVMSSYAADIVTFDLPPPLQSKGADALDKKALEAWFSSFQGAIGYEIRDLRITAGDEVAYCYCLNRISGTRSDSQVSSDGEETNVWVRATVCFRKIDGKWMVAHEHISVPLYMDGSNRAAVDLKP